MASFKRILAVNFDDSSLKSIEEGLKDSVYQIDYSALFLDSMKKLSFNNYDLVFVVVGNAADAYIVSDVHGISDKQVVAMTRRDPREYVDWNGINKKIPLKDYLYMMGASLVVHIEDISQETKLLPLYLDSMLDPATSTITAAPHHPHP